MSAVLRIITTLALGLLLSVFGYVHATEAVSDTAESVAGLQGEAPPTIEFFYSETCPHCRAEQAFLNTLEERYPTLVVNRYPVTDPAVYPRLRELLAAHAAERYLGTVPLTFIGDTFIVGFGTPQTTGREIEEAVTPYLADVAQSGTDSTALAPAQDSFTVPLVGTVDAAQYPTAVLALVLGFLDGFNVCSLGALVLIIGLSLKLQRRRAIILFGGTFIVITALVYGALIVLWYQLFQTVGQYLDLMKVAVMLLSLGGGLYFLKEFLRMQKQGAVCELQESPLIARLSQRTAHAFSDTTTALSLIGIVVLFAGVVAVVEFPCSAAVPVAFAALLADLGLSTAAYIGHIALFVLAYMLDELIIFGVAAWRLKLWMTSGTFTKWAVLGEALILLGIGVWYALALR